MRPGRYCICLSQGSSPARSADEVLLGEVGQRRFQDRPQHFLPIATTHRTPSGIVEYRMDGDTVQADFCAVPGLRGMEDMETMPEFAPAMAEFEAPATE
jgi:hypothetical protein